MAETNETDPEETRIVEVVCKDIKVRGPIFQALISALSAEISHGGPLTRPIRRTFEIPGKGQ